MKLIANKQICCSSGIVAPGGTFDENSDDARELVRAGLARYYETKVITPAPLVAEPFRHWNMPDDAKQDPILAALDRELAQADVPEAPADAPTGRGRSRKVR